MRIGIDFDNTLAGYDHVFALAARQRGLVPPDFGGDKRAVRSALRALPEGERQWMALQGEVYGPCMAEARMIDGADRFLARCRAEGHEVVIISHKTEFGHFDPTATNLRDAARAWMTAKGFFDPAGFALRPENVVFEATRAEKIARITERCCDIFIDDLEEVLLDPAFPAACRRLHLAGESPHPGLESFPGWAEIHDAVF